MATIVYSSSGVQKAVARFHGTKDGDDYAYAITVDKSGNVAVAGSATNKNTSTDFTTIKYHVPLFFDDATVKATTLTVKNIFGIITIYPNPVTTTANIQFHLA